MDGVVTHNGDGRNIPLQHEVAIAYGISVGAFPLPKASDLRMYAASCPDGSKLCTNARVMVTAWGSHAASLATILAFLFAAASLIECMA